MANTSATWQQAAHTTYQLSPPSCSKKAISKSLTLNKKNSEFSERTISRKMTRQKEQEDQTEKVREEIKKERRIKRQPQVSRQGNITHPRPPSSIVK